MRVRKKYIFICFFILCFITLIGYPQKNTISANDSIWTNLTPVPYIIHNNPLGIYNNYLFSFGGSANIVNNEVLRGVIDQGGLISSWDSSSTAQPKRLFWHNFAAVDDYVYILGGCEYPNYQTISTNTVYRGQITNGLVQNWTQMPNLNTPISDGSSISVGSKIYYSGGGYWNGSNYDTPIISNIVLMTEVNENGEFGSWNYAGSIPQEMGVIGHATVNIGNYMYFIGGIKKVCDDPTTSCYKPTNEVWRAAIDGQNGSLTGWVNTGNSVGDPAYHTMVTKVGDYVVVAGGRGVKLHDSKTYDTVYYAKILPGGILDTWKLSDSPLPRTTCCAGVATLNDKVYITGGHDGSVYFDSVWMATIGDIIGQPDITPTPLPTLVPTSTPIIKNPVVFIPGMFACWNKDVILHEGIVTNNQWSIPHFVDVYDGLLMSLVNSGYERDKNLFLYCYDWRKNVVENAASLSAYIFSNVLSNKPQGTTVDLVGHSMGGLIARATASNNMLPIIGKVITLGSPHTGATMAYLTWEGADFTKLISWQRVLGELYLRIRSPKFGNQVAAAQAAIPSLQNLLPIYGYLKDLKGVIKPVDSLVWKNDLFPTLDQYLPPLLSKLTTIGGKGWNTLKYIKVKQPSEKDKLQGKWVDGEPVSSETSLNGDGTVLLESALISSSENVWEIDGADHGQLVTEVAGQLKVLQALGIEGDTHIVYPKKFNRAVVVALGSPATFSVTDPNGNILNPTDGILIINDPFDGNYKVSLLSSGAGLYTLYFGRLAPKDSAWETTQGNFSDSGQLREYVFATDFNLKNLGANPLKSALLRMKLLRQKVQNSAEKWTTKLIFGNFLDQLEKMIRRMERESGKKLEVYTLAVIKYIDKIIDSSIKISNVEIIEELRLIKLDIWEYLDSNI